MQKNKYIKFYYNSSFYNYNYASSFLFFPLIVEL